jgi:hypothetical protein
MDSGQHVMKISVLNGSHSIRCKYKNRVHSSKNYYSGFRYSLMYALKWMQILAK